MRKIATMLICFLFAGCATGGASFSKLEQGMSKEDVISVVGRPDGFRSDEGVEYLIYNNRYVNPWHNYDQADYVVAIKDGKVVEYQAINYRDGTARQQAASATMGVLGLQIMNNANRVQPVQYVQPMPITCRSYATGITTCH